MTTISDPRSGLPGPAQTQVNYDEPAAKPPPLLVVGPLAWIRNNLFRSTFDTILTLGFAALAISIITGLITWAVQAANWFVITKNLRLFMVGRFPVDQLWRTEWIALFIVFLGGFGLATYSRLSRRLGILLTVLLALTFIIPAAVRATTTPAHSFLAAGNFEIPAGTVKETPISELGFTGHAGEQITISYPIDFNSDASLTRLAGFTDRATSAMLNSAKGRQRQEQDAARLAERLANDPLTDEQRETMTATLAGIDIAPPVSETLGINTAPVTVQILDGETFDVLAEATLPTDSTELSLTLPHEGWYVLRKTMQDEQSVVILEASGVEPVLVSELSALDVRYRSMTSDFETGARRPRVDGQDLPIINIIDYQYSGERSLPQFLKLHLAPFLEQLNRPLLFLLVAGGLGYAGSRALRRYSPPDERDRLPLRAFSVLFLISPIVIYILLAAVSTSRWGGLLLTFMLTAVGIVLSFPIGVLLALGRRSGLPVVKGTSILLIELVRGVPLITVLFIANLMLPMLHPSLVRVDAVLRAMAGITLFSAAYLAENVRGGLQAIPPGQEEAARALGLSSLQVTLFITLPQALRAVIPALVGQAISLFKDTSLVAIIGLFDLTRIADSVISQPEFIGARPESYLFISIIYFLFSYLMAWASRKVEASGSGAARRF